jgi:hypothetical protein
LFSSSILASTVNVAKYHSYSPYKLKRRHRVINQYIISLIMSYWLPPSTMDAVLATIVDGGWAILLKTQRSIEKKIFLLYFKSYYSIFFGCGLGQPLGRVARALGCADTSNPRHLKDKWLRHHGRGIYCTFCGLWWMVS